MNRTIAILCVSLAACTAPEPAPAEPPPLLEAAIAQGYPEFAGPCRGGLSAPTRLVVTSTDFNTGAVGLVELASRSVLADLAPASSDAVPVVVDGRVFVINRFGFDYVDELDPADSLALIYEFPILANTTDAPANPQALVFDSQDRAWISLLGAGELQQFEFPTLIAAQPSARRAVDLRGFADADGIPELGALIACGDLLFVAATRIDRGNWVPADETLLIPLTVAGDTPTLHEFDPDRPGPDAIRLRGDGVGRWRLDPGDPSGRTVLLLNSGLERVELGSGTSEWLVDEQVFAEAGYGRLQLSSFDLDGAGRIWISAASEDFSSFRILRVELDDDAPQLVPVIEGLQSVTGAMLIVADELWFADTTIGASGLRVFALDGDDATELPESPLAVGLPPMSIAAL